MPFINIALFEGRSAEEKTALAERIADAMHDVMGVKPEHLWIRFDDTALEDWFTGGRSAASIRAERDGTNQS